MKTYAKTTANSLYDCFTPYLTEKFHNDYVFLDIGAGIGNCCLVAAEFFNIKKSIGVEYSDEHGRIFKQILSNITRFTTTPIQHIVDDICNRPDLFKIATHVYSLNPKWPDVTITWILQQLCMVECTVDIIIWAVEPERAASLCTAFFRYDCKTKTAWSNGGTRTAKLSGSKSQFNMFVYRRQSF